MISEPIHKTHRVLDYRRFRILVPLLRPNEVRVTSVQGDTGTLFETTSIEFALAWCDAFEEGARWAEKAKPKS